ncbi:amidohydrolase family protein [Herbaspirillum chlorophenolicum]|uniref:amidohydrolase family protein n=1 Tax=Herbaspirillum chlorophenolicum TaxID=211589 RepID=UPI00067CA49B|nr:amidohydrolase family protein [Herbaspirillum chlorophenolicum]
MHSSVSTAGAEKIIRVDSHTHIMLRDAELVAGRHSEPKRDITAEELLALFDQHGITHGVLTQPSFYGTDNALLLSALKRYPDRLRGTAIVAPDIAEQALAGLYSGGIRGLRLNWLRKDDLPDAAGKAYQRLFGLAREAGMHIELYIEGAKMPQVLRSIRHSGVAVVVDHFGSPEPDSGINGEGFQAVLAGVRDGNTWVKLSAPYRLGGMPADGYVQALLQAGGPSQLMWGSDWPWVSHEDTQSYAQCLADFERWVPDARQRLTIWRDTPQRLFGF